jgi:rRNA-processing protein FCF1
MTPEQGRAKRIRELQHLRRNHRAEIENARSEAERAQALDRVRECDSAIERIKSGGRG